MFSIINKTYVTIATLVAAMSLGTLFSSQYFIFDIISHFRIHYLVLLVPAYVIAIAIKKSKSVLIISLALAIHGYVVTMAVLPRHSLTSEAEYTELTVMSANVLGINNNYDELVALVSRIEPDVIALQEYTPAWDAALQTKLTDYPHRVTYPKNDNFGSAIYSKHALNYAKSNAIIIQSKPTAVAQVLKDEKAITVYSTHPPPPISQFFFKARNETMQAVATDVAEQATSENTPAIVMGDFNTTPWNTHFSKMLVTGQLYNARAGFGLKHTWPSHLALIGVPIDHILTTSQIRSVSFETEIIDGSDHLAVWSTLRVYD